MYFNIKYFSARYQFNADNAGTHFWHSHAGLQKMDGIFGNLVVRQSQKRDVNSYLYDYDLSRHTVVINDWMHELASERIPGSVGKQFQDPNAFLINGKGQYRVKFNFLLFFYMCAWDQVIFFNKKEQ